MKAGSAGRWLPHPGYGRGWRNRTPFVAGARSRSHARTRSHPPRGHTIGRPPAPLPLWFFPYFPTFHKLNTPLKSVFGCGYHPRRHPDQEHQQGRGGAESLAGQVCRDSAVSGGLRFPWLRPTGSLFLSVTFFFLPKKKKKKQLPLVTSAPDEAGSVTPEDTTFVSVGENFVFSSCVGCDSSAPHRALWLYGSLSLCVPQSRGLNPAPAPPTYLPLRPLARPLPRGYGHRVNGPGECVSSTETPRAPCPAEVTEYTVTYLNAVGSKSTLPCLFTTFELPVNYSHLRWIVFLLCNSVIDF